MTSIMTANLQNLTDTTDLGRRRKLSSYLILDILDFMT
jgi:hypothetical protein